LELPSAIVTQVFSNGRVLMSKKNAAGIQASRMPAEFEVDERAALSGSSKSPPNRRKS
jgi:hypothetical protein